MHRYLARRIVSLFIVLVVMSVVVFIILRALPGDVVDVLQGEESATLTAAQEQALRERLGIDRPLHEQYFSWIGGIVTRGDFGSSLYTQQSVNTLFKQRLPVTILLTAYSIGFMVLIGIPLGVISALRANSPVDLLARIVAVLGLSVPSFWLGILSLIALVTWLNWSPPLGYSGPIADLSEHAQQMVLPSVIGGLAFGAILARMTRSSMLEVMGEDYIRTARSKGLAERFVVARHAAPNVMLPVLTVIGIQAAAVIGGVVVLESVFSLPGFGTLMIDAVHNRDYAVVQSSLMLVAAGVILINLVTDILYAYVDPRVRYD